MSVRIHLIYNGTVWILCTGVCTGGWICQGGYSYSVQWNYMNIILVYVREDNYAREDTAARYNGTIWILCTGVCTGRWICQRGYIYSVQRNCMNIMYWFMYRRVDRAGRINLLGSTKQYEYVLVYVQEDGYAREDTYGTIWILCTCLYVYVQEGG